MSRSGTEGFKPVNERRRRAVSAANEKEFRKGMAGAGRSQPLLPEYSLFRARVARARWIARSSVARSRPSGFRTRRRRRLPWRRRRRRRRRRRSLAPRRRISEQRADARQLLGRCPIDRTENRHCDYGERRCRENISLLHFPCPLLDGRELVQLGFTRVSSLHLYLACGNVFPGSIQGFPPPRTLTMNAPGNPIPNEAAAGAASILSRYRAVSLSVAGLGCEVEGSS